MAVIQPTLPATATTDSAAVRWSGVGNSDTGAGANAAPYRQRCVHVRGTFGVGGTVEFQGSNNGTTWSTLPGPTGTPMSFTAAGVLQCGALPQFVRPNVTAGDGTTSVTVDLFMQE